METLRHSLRLAGRRLVRRPGLLVLCVLTLAVAVAGNGVILALCDAVLLEPLPFARPGELVTLDARSTQGYYISTSIPNYRDWRDRSRAFSAFAAQAGWTLTLTGRGPAEVLEASAVVGDLFGVLGVAPRLGRTFTATPDHAGAEAEAVVSHGFWQRRLGGDSEALGRTVTLDGRPYAVVGVMPASFRFPSPDTELWVPMGSIPDLPWDDRSSSFGTRSFARLAPGVDAAAAERDLERVHREVEELTGEPQARPEVRSLTRYLVGRAPDRLLLLLGAVGLVLLLAVANVTHLLLARAEGRRREMTVRLALGAARWSVARELMVDGLLAAAGGGLLGLGLARALLPAVVERLPEAVPAALADRVAIDFGVAAATIGLALAAGAAAGAWPALRGAGSDLAARLREQERGSTPGPGRLRAALVVAEVTLCTVLLVGAALMAKSLLALDRVDKGFEAERAVAARVAPPAERYADADSWRSLFTELEARAGRLPGVTSAALALLVPLEGRAWELRVHREGADLEEEGDSVLFNVVSGGYFRTLGVPLVAGRGFDDGDREGTRPVAVVDETLAERYWPGEEAVGRRIHLEEHDEAGEPVFRTVVGVARNVRHYELESPSRIQAYVPFLQSGPWTGMSLHVVMRTAGPPESAIAPLAAELADLDPEAPLYRVRTLEQRVADASAESRALAALLAVFGAVALALAALGIFGVLSSSVVERLREIGVRMALGAGAREILGSVLGRSLRLSALGVVLGLAAAAGLSRLLAGFLFAVDPVEPPLYAALACGLLFACLVAAAAPAVRAARVDPVRVLGGDG